MNKKYSLFFLFIISISFISAQSIQVEYPSSVKVNEEFSLSLKLIGFQDDVYDIKIDINPTERIAQINNNGAWKSTFYYVNDIISSSNSYGEKKLNIKIIKNYQGEVPLEIKIKSSSDTTKSFLDYKINIKGTSSDDSDIEDDNSNNEEDSDDLTKEDGDKNDEKTEDETKEIINITKEIPKNKSIQLEIIKLNPATALNTKDIKSDKITKLDKNKLAKYGLIGFSILLIILFVFKNKKDNKNEFR